MTKVAAVFAEGFEEIEALSPVDVFRRAGLISMLGLESVSVTGSWNSSLWMVYLIITLADYDLVASWRYAWINQSTRQRNFWLSLYKRLQKLEIVAAICAAPPSSNVLACSIVANSHFPGVEEQIASGEHPIWWSLTAILSQVVVPKQHWHLRPCLACWVRWSAVGTYYGLRQI